MRIALIGPGPVAGRAGDVGAALTGLAGSLGDDTHDVVVVTHEPTGPRLADVVADARAVRAIDLADADLVVTTTPATWPARHGARVALVLEDRARPPRLPAGRPPAPAIRSRAGVELRDLLRQPPPEEELDGLLDAVDAVADEIGAEHPDLATGGRLDVLVRQAIDRAVLSPPTTVRFVVPSHAMAARPGLVPPGVRPLVARPPATAAGPRVAPADPMAVLVPEDDPRFDVVAAAVARLDGAATLVVARPDVDAVDACGVVALLAADRPAPLLATDVLARGRPIVTAVDAGAAAELVRPGRDGHVVAPDPETVAGALRRLLGTPITPSRADPLTWEPVRRAVLAERRRPASVATGGRRARRRVVVATAAPLDGAVGGGPLRARHLYGALAPDLDVDVVSLGLAGDRPGTVEIDRGVRQTTVRRSPEQQRAADDAAGSVGSSVTDVLAGTDAHLTPGLLGTLAEAADGAQAVILDQPYLHPAVRAAGIDLPIVFDAHNDEVALKAGTWPDGPGRDVLLLGLVEAIQADAVAAASAVTACSPIDAASLADRHGVADVIVVPNGAEVPTHPVEAAERRRRSARWRTRAEADGRSALAVFFGSWHPPNIDAAELLVEVAAALPHLHVLSVGHHGAVFAGRDLPPNITFTGTVADPVRRTLLATADIAVNPMRIGSGTNLKLLEYLAWQIPVVSTAFGARGIDVEDGVHLTLAPAEGLAGAVTAVIDDPDGRARRAAAGRERIVERYDWRRSAAAFRRVVDGVTA